MNRLWVLVVIGLLSTFSTGCATLLRGDKQKMKFEANAPNATATIDGKSHTLPTTVALARKEPHTIVVGAPGYQTIQFELNSQWDGYSLPDLAPPGGSVLFAYDAVTGADRKFYPLAKIQLDRGSPGASNEPVKMYEFRGKVLDKSGYEKSKKDLHEFHRQQSYGGTY